MKRWKVAISLAVAAAIVTPAATGVWRLAPARWVDLTTSQKERIWNYLGQTKSCTLLKRGDIDEAKIGFLVARNENAPDRSSLRGFFPFGSFEPSDAARAVRRSIRS
jgi:hypothetical protein